MSKRKEFLTKLRDRIANPETKLIGCRYRNFDGDCCVIGYAALEAGVEPDTLMPLNVASIRDIPTLVAPLIREGLTLADLYTLQRVNDGAYPEGRKASVLECIDDLLTTDET